jgi:hypothetical protein
MRALLCLFTSQLRTHCLDGCEQSIACEFHGRNGAFGGVAMAEAASVFDYHGNVAKVGTMARGRFNADFHGDASDREGGMPPSGNAMSKGVPSKADMVLLSKIASFGCGFISGTGWNPGESRRKQGVTSFNGFHSLPTHSRAQ